MDYNNNKQVEALNATTAPLHNAGEEAWVIATSEGRYWGRSFDPIYNLPTHGWVELDNAIQFAHKKSAEDVIDIFGWSGEKLAVPVRASVNKAPTVVIVFEESNEFPVSKFLQDWADIIQR